MKKKPKEPIIRTWNIVRIVKETYQVEAATKEEARFNTYGPNTITVIKETIKLAET